MKETFRKDVFRNIKKRLVSWLSMAAIVFIGISMIMGLYLTYSSSAEAGDSFFTEHAFKDLDIVCSLGVTDADISRISEMEGIDVAEGALSIPGQLSCKGTNVGATILSVTDAVSIPYTIEGVMPKSADECALTHGLAEELGASIGDTISISLSSARLSNALSEDEYTVTGFILHPDYLLSTEYSYCVLPQESFDTSSIAFDYTDILVRISLPQGVTYLDGEYDEAVRDVTAHIEAEIGMMTEERREALSDALDEEYASAYEEADRRLSDARAELDSAHQEFDDEIGKAREELEKGEEELSSAKEEVERELATAARQIRDGEAEYNTQVAEGEARLAQAEAAMEAELEHAKWEIFDGFLQLDNAEKLLNEKEDEYKAAQDRLSLARVTLDDGWAEYNSGISELDKALNISSVDKVIDEIEDGAVPNAIISEIRLLASEDAVTRGSHLLSLYDGLSEDVKSVIRQFYNVNDLRNAINRLTDAKARLEDGEREYDEGLSELKAAREELDSGWFTLEQGKIRLAEAQAEFAIREPEARKQLEDAKAEFANKKEEGAKKLAEAKSAYAAKKKEAEDTLSEYEAKIEAGRTEFDKSKANGEERLTEADREYAEAEAETTKQLAELRKQIDEAGETPIEWLVQTREANLYYTSYVSMVKVLLSVCFAFAPIFAMVVVVVCFFTMAIIVEEQSRQIGTCKAFGMYKSEIFIKYLIFGATAAVFGDIVGLISSIIIRKYITDTLLVSYTLDEMPLVINIPITGLILIAAILVTSVAVMWSANKVISCSAVGLLSGNEPVKRSRKRASRGSTMSVYFKLIITNFVMDYGRQIVSVSIILMCCMLIGLGATIKLGFDTALNNQVETIETYDISVTMSENATEEEYDRVNSLIAQYPHIAIGTTGGIFLNDDGQMVSTIYCVPDTESFATYFTLRDDMGHAVEIPDEGILATLEMKEKNGIEKDKPLTLVDSELKQSEVYTRGFYLLNVGKTVIMSSDYYQERTGEDPPVNTYLIKTEDADPDSVISDLQMLSGISNITTPVRTISEMSNLSSLYTVLVLIVIGFSIILSFMILLNLSNILVNHRMKELLTMRVNGFSYAQVIGYLSREVIVTTILGLIMALLFGMPVSLALIPVLETDGFMALRQIYPLAWVLALGCNAVFAVFINALAFRRVNKVPLTDITKY